MQGSSLSNTFGFALAQNKELAKTASYFEAGRIANNKLTQLIAPNLPMMLRGYADHPLAKVLVANIALMAIQKFKPSHEAANKLGFAMVTQAYAGAFESLNIEGLIDRLLGDSALAQALNLAEANSPQ